jgi:anti-anti-sigma factor
MSLLADIELQEREGVPVASVRGEVDVSNADDIGRQLHGLVPNSAPGLVLDLAETTYFDSSGVRLLFDLGERLGRRQQALRVVVADGSFLADLLQTINFVVFAPVDGDVDEAIAELRRSAPDNASPE